MEKPLPLIERAYELAKSGRCASVEEIRRHLKQEGYLLGEILRHMDGRALRHELTRLCKQHSLKGGRQLRGPD